MPHTATRTYAIPTRIANTHQLNYPCMQQHAISIRMCVDDDDDDANDRTNKVSAMSEAL